MLGTTPVLGHATTVDRDREFDQTAKTDTSAECTMHNAQFQADGFAGALREHRHVSPAIHEHRINVLEQQKRELTDALDRETVAHGKTQNELNVANARIKQFEDFTRTLAAKCDQMIERCEHLGIDILDLPPAVETPAAVETHADGVRETASNPCSLAILGTGSGTGGRCIKPRYHLGPCMTGAAA